MGECVLTYPEVQQSVVLVVWVHDVVQHAEVAYAGR